MQPREGENLLLEPGTFHFTDQYTTTRPPVTLNSSTCGTTVDITTNFGNCVIS